MEDKLDIIIKNQETLNKNQLIIFNELLRIEERLYKSESKEFIRNYLADSASTVTSVLGLEDILKKVKISS